MKRRTLKKRASRVRQAERWEYVHGRGCTYHGCPAYQIAHMTQVELDELRASYS